MYWPVNRILAFLIPLLVLCVVCLLPGTQHRIALICKDGGLSLGAVYSKLIWLLIMPSSFQ